MDEPTAAVDAQQVPRDGGDTIFWRPVQAPPRDVEPFSVARIADAGDVGVDTFDISDTIRVALLRLAILAGHETDA